MHVPFAVVADCHPACCHLWTGRAHICHEDFLLTQAHRDRVGYYPELTIEHRLDCFLYNQVKLIKSTPSTINIIDNYLLNQRHDATNATSHYSSPI